MQIGQTEPKGYPKAYYCTPRGKVCSKSKAIKIGIRKMRIPTKIYHLNKHFALLVLCVF